MSVVIVKQSTAGSSLYYEGVSVASRRIDWTRDLEKARKLTKPAAEHVCERYSITDYQLQEVDDDRDTA